MSNEETKEKLLSCAKNEFLEKGFMKASLRSICNNAGVTTGALYFFFKNKEDLFGSLVQEVLDKITETMNEHYSSEICSLKEDTATDTDFSSDLNAAENVIHYIYQYYDEFLLLVSKSQGSKYEHVVDEFVTVTEKHYKLFAQKTCEKLNIPKIDDYIIHWISHMHIEAFIHIIVHPELSEEEAKKHMKTVMKYFINGWFGLFKEDIK